MTKSLSNHAERVVEKTLFGARWLLVPMYLGLSVLLVIATVKFIQELIHMLPAILAMSETDFLIAALALVDLVLVGSLIVMVMISGYENFVSRLDFEAGDEKLSWVGKLDAGTLKIKLAVTIVAISAIHLLKSFMNAHQVPNDKLMWMVIIHLTFVVSAVGLAYIDRLAFAGHREH
jgi:uncharacterized protein (TIGR00645 family)